MPLTPKQRNDRWVAGISNENIPWRDMELSVDEKKKKRAAAKALTR